MVTVCDFACGQCCVCGAPMVNARQVCGTWSEEFERSRVAAGPGTELKKILARAGITPSPGCRCVERAAIMDRNGCDWVEANVPTVLAWLREEAAARGLPFLDAVGRILVRRAVANAKTRAGGVSGPAAGE